MSRDVYKTIASPAEGIYKDRGSKFLSYAFPVANEEEIKAHLAALKKEHHSARHHCYAWQLGYDEDHFRMNDDGEPSGTAGKPIYGQILSKELTNVVIFVVRYFGGTLLGTSGLIKAYRSAAGDCLANAKIIRKTRQENFEISFGYELMNPVMRLIDEEELLILEKEFRESCRMRLSVRQSALEKVLGLFRKIPGIQFIE